MWKERLERENERMDDRDRIREKNSQWSRETSAMDSEKVGVLKNQEPLSWVSTKTCYGKSAAAFGTFWFITSAEIVILSITNYSSSTNSSLANSLTGFVAMF